ncbi:unnamed protein product [Scytosiphon promiscuus]
MIHEASILGVSQHAVVTTDRLTLRPLRAADAAQLSELGNNLDVARNLSDGFPHPYTRADAEGFIASKPDSLAVVLSQGELFIGVIGSSQAGGVGGSSKDGDACFCLGYWIGRDYWGKGFATEAVGGFVHHIEQTRGVRRIEASVYHWNPASAKVLEKNGFRCEARVKASSIRFGEVADNLVYAKLHPSLDRSIR